MDLLPPLLSFLFMQAEPAPDIAPEAVPAPLPVPVSVPAPMPVPAPAPAQVFPVTIAASVGGGLFRQGDSAHGRVGEGQVAADWFLRRPVVDDGVPYGLQSYLQRADHLSLGIEGSLSSTTFSDPSVTDPLSERYRDRRFAGYLAGLFYRGWAVFGGEIEYSKVSARFVYTVGAGDPIEQRVQRQYLRPSATFGFRDQTFELRISYIYVAYFDYPSPIDSGAIRNVELGASYFRNPGWGQGMVLGKFILDGSSSFTLAAFTLADGGGSSARYEFFPNPRVGIWLGGDFQEEQTSSWPLTSYDGLNASLSVVGYTMAHGEIGVEWWRSNRFALLGWIRAGLVRETVGPREAYGTETPYLELIANLGVVARVRGRASDGEASHAGK